MQQFKIKQAILYKVLDSTKAAVAAAASSLPAGDQPWTNVTVVNPPGADSFSIAFWLLE